MALTAKERAEYLDVLRAHGGDKAYLAGLDMLQAMDSGKGLPKQKTAKGAKQDPAIAQLQSVGATAGAKKIPWNKIFCSATCALSNNPKKDPVGFAACVLQCITNKEGGSSSSSGGGGNT